MTPAVWVERTFRINFIVTAEPPISKCFIAEEKTQMMVLTKINDNDAETGTGVVGQGLSPRPACSPLSPTVLATLLKRSRALTGMWNHSFPHF